MKAVLLPIHPRYCEKIANGAKTVEVRKTAPKLETPFKAYVYCTSVKSLPLEEYVTLHASTGGLCDKWSGRVIGEFMCKEIREYKFPYSLENCGGISVEELKATCLSADEFCKYGAGKPLYGWHICDLKIYDKPKELGEFRKPCNFQGDCAFCRRAIERPQMSYGGKLEYFMYDCDNKFARPPQSYMFVEEL